MTRQTTLLTPAQAAEALGVSRSRIYHLIAAGRLQATKPGRDWLIRPSDIEAVRHRTPGRPALPRS